MRTIVYAATRNLYENLRICVNSAIKNGNVDEIVLLIEDDTFPHEFNFPVRTINVSNQSWIDRNGINALKHWTYMCLMKTTMTELFPELDRVLVLDCDTIVEHELKELWQINLDNYYYAMVMQNNDGRGGKFHKGDYYNAGVLLCNLKKLRDGKEAEIRESLNTKEWEFPEQDCIVKLCEGQIYSLPGRWNRSDYTKFDTEQYIRHYAATDHWWKLALPQKYDY